MADSSEGQKVAEKPRGNAYPRAFGSYLLLNRVARGGMGEVFLAKSGGIAGIEKHCVVKTLRAHFTADREYVTRFIDEARVVVQLAHRNIAQIFDVGRVSKQYYLAMEYIAGRDLRSLAERLEHRGMQLPENVALFILGEILEALDYAHRHVDPGSGTPLNVVHRDISPQNVMISFEGEVKLIDFGLAHSTMKVEQTQPNVVMGKMAYMSPEQARGDDVDGRADLFSAAVLGYELLTGERYYEGLGFDQIWSIAGTGGYRPRLWDQLHPELAKALGSGLEATTEDRFRTGADFKDALLDYQMSRRLKPIGREMRQLMAELFGDESISHRELIARFQNVSAIGNVDEVAPKEESQSFAIANVESFLDGAAVPDRNSEILQLHPGDQTATEVAPKELTDRDSTREATDERSIIPEMPTLIQSESGSGEILDRAAVVVDQDATYVVRNTRDVTLPEHPGDLGHVLAGAAPARGPNTRLLAALAGVVVSLAGVAVLLFMVVPSSEGGEPLANPQGPTGNRLAAPVDEAPPAGAAPRAGASEGNKTSAPSDKGATDRPKAAPTTGAAVDSRRSSPDPGAAVDPSLGTTTRASASDPGNTEPASASDSSNAKRASSGADAEKGTSPAREAKTSSSAGKDDAAGKTLSGQGGDANRGEARAKKRRRPRRAAKTTRPTKKPPAKTAAVSRPKPVPGKPKLSTAGKAAYKSAGKSRSKVWDFLQTHCRHVVSCAKRMKKPNLRKVPLSEVGPLTEKALACARKCNAQGG